MLQGFFIIKEVKIIFVIILFNCTTTYLYVHIITPLIHPVMLCLLSEMTCFNETHCLLLFSMVPSSAGGIFFWSPYSSFYMCMCMRETLKWCMFLLKEKGECFAFFIYFSKKCIWTCFSQVFLNIRLCSFKMAFMSPKLGFIIFPPPSC